MVLVVHWDEIKNAGLTLDCQEDVRAFPALLELEQSGECRFQSPVDISLRAYSVGGMVEVSGHARVSTVMACGRCLKDYVVSLDAPVELTLARELPRIEQEDSDEEEDGVELSAEEMGLILIDGDEYDLHDAVAEHLIISIPLKPLCRNDCKGLCPVCGIDLDSDSCDCRPGGALNKFAALKDFKVQK